MPILLDMLQEVEKIDQFKTIVEKNQEEIVEKKSKFIASIFPVNTVEEAEEVIKITRKKYFDARHNCIAYRIIEENQIIEKASDDGEPSGTAGGPMLNILQKNNLANIVVIVTRYFGGILLGTGGLVRAYSDSLLKAINSSEIIEKELGDEIEVKLEYNNFEVFKYYCKNNKIKIANVDFREQIVCKIEMKEEKKDKLIKDYETKKLNLNEIKEISKKYIEKCI